MGGKEKNAPIGIDYAKRFLSFVISHWSLVIGRNFKGVSFVISH
jgi:hypothetical protein